MLSSLETSMMKYLKLVIITIAGIRVEVIATPNHSSRIYFSPFLTEKIPFLTSQFPFCPFSVEIDNHFSNFHYPNLTFFSENGPFSILKKL